MKIPCWQAGLCSDQNIKLKKRLAICGEPFLFGFIMAHVSQVRYIRRDLVFSLVPRCGLVWAELDARVSKDTKDKENTTNATEISASKEQTNLKELLRMMKGEV